MMFGRGLRTSGCRGAESLFQCRALVPRVDACDDFRIILTTGWPMRQRHKHWHFEVSNGSGYCVCHQAHMLRGLNRCSVFSLSWTVRTCKLSVLRFGDCCRLACKSLVVDSRLLSVARGVGTVRDSSSSSKGFFRRTLPMH